MTTARQVYAMLDNETLWDTAARCDSILTEAGIAYSVCGGVAVCLHGYQRNTVDLDLVVRRDDTSRVRQLLEEAGFGWHQEAKEFRTKAGVAVQFLISGETAGGEVKVAEPSGDENVEVIEGLTVLRLSRLIEMKLACGAANIRRTHKDFADVVELIAIRKLDGSFSRFLHKSLRKIFRELVKNAHGGG
ncbi:MAG: hypothetical protein HYV60_20660 [Planctomycetia bacterium]|nr:hypothetical protein [Planctomycetia bacterium]